VPNLGKKLYLIGIDAAPLWLIEKFKNEKHMSAFRKLLEGKQLIDMESTLPPMTGGAWPTIYTGLPPGKHGVPDFFVMKKDYTPDLVYYDSERTPPFWKNLASSGNRCLVITPATDIKLPDYPNVDMITGFPLKARSNSKFLISLMKKYSFYGEPDVEKDMKSGKMSDEEGTKHFLKSIKARIEIAKEAMKRHDYDLVYVCFTETDRLQHFVLNKENMKDYILPVYQEIGKYLEYVMDRADEEGGAVMVVSDHGAQPIKEKFLINTWMINEGFAKLKDSVMESITESSGESDASPSFREKLLKTKLRDAYDKLPHAAKGIVSKSMGKLLPVSKGGKYTRIHLFDYEMLETKAFAAISNINVATIWINDSRFEKGIVNGSEKSKLKSQITRKLEGLRNDKGEKLIVKVYDGDKYYNKTKLFIPPDLLVEIRPGYMIDIFNFSKDSLFMEPEPPKRGDHTRLGIFGMYPQKPRTRSSIFSILDVCPTILDYFKQEK
jgi:predicted AlkP superfamily phosphohydrolase/phosphomutase